MSYATIDDLRSQLGQVPTDTAYAEKQLHKVPAATVVVRRDFILERVTGKRVLEFGASGPLHDAIVNVAAFAFGVDRVGNCPHIGAESCVSGCVVGFDLDDITETGLPGLVPEIIVCGEVLEHLGNPLWFLTRLRKQYEGVPVIITVPNAFGKGSDSWLAKGIENVNRDHCCWFSSKTLNTLVERAGYHVTEFYWYNGVPLFAEGLIFVCE